MHNKRSPKINVHWIKQKKYQNWITDRQNFTFDFDTDIIKWNISMSADIFVYCTYLLLTAQKVFLRIWYIPDLDNGYKFLFLLHSFWILSLCEWVEGWLDFYQFRMADAHELLTRVSFAHKNQAVFQADTIWIVTN